MIKSFFTRFLFFLSLIFLLSSSLLKSQQTVFSENFNAPGTPQNSAYTTSGPIGSSRWTVTRSGNDLGAKIDQGFLTLTNDVGSIGNVKGWVLASTSTSNFLPAYNPILSQNPGIVSWTFNMRQIRTNPAGLTDGLFGVGYVLAGTDGSTNKVGKGYAIMLGQSGTKDAIRFVTYNNGIQTYYTKLSSSTSGLSDFGSEYSSIRVEYNPANNEWSMYVRKDNSTSFNDPKSGTLIFQGKVANSDFVNEALTMTGAYWNAATAKNQTAFFDNISVSVVTPEIISINPDSKIANSGAFTLTVDGKGFTNASKVYWNGLLRNTTYISANQISASIPGTDLPAPGMIPITVRNGSFISNAVDFEIESSGVPVLTLSKTILPFISTVQGTASVATDTYTISGSNLTASAILTAPVNFEISKDGSTYSDNITLPYTIGTGTLTGQPITLRARIKASAPAGNYTGNITHTTTGALTTKVVGVTGRVLATEPTADATLPTFTNITSTGFRLGWTNSGNGDQRIVLVRPATAVNGVPVDATTYNASPTFGTGSLIGTDNYVVYKGSGNFIQIAGLQPSTAYYISIIEFNGLPGTENYRNAGLTGTATTLNRPAGLQVKAVNTSYQINFDDTVDGVNLDTFQGIGMSNIVESGQLDSNSWAFSGFSGGNIAFGGNSVEDSSYENGPSDGEEDDTGIYAFNVGTDTPNYTLGVQPGGTGTSADFNPGTITLKIQNQNAAVITSLNIGYKVYVYNDQAASSKIAFNYSSDQTGTTGFSTADASLDVVSPAAADLAPGWKAYYRVTTITGLNIAKDKFFYIRWTGSSTPTSGLKDEFAIDDIEVIANPVAPNTVSFDGVAEDFVLQGNASLSGDLSVQNRLLFNGGKLAIKDKTLTIAGSVMNTTTNGLTGEGNSKLVVRGTQNPSLSFDAAANSLKVLDLFGANGNKVTLLTNIAVNDSLKVYELQTLDLGTNTLTGSLSYIINNGTILTQNTSDTPFPAGKIWSGKGILNMNALTAQKLVAGTYSNLTLSSKLGTKALANVTVNGILNLPEANASSTEGSLSMGAFTLTMGENGTNTGVGEVSGIIRRNSFTTNKLYTFGHPNSSIIFPGGGTKLPETMSAKLTLGINPTWRTGAIKRYYDIIQTGAEATKAIIRQHYLDSELNDNTESKLVFWGHKVEGAVDFEQGRSSNNSTDNWVEISNANVAQYFENQFGKVYITLDDTQGIGQVVWNGSKSTSWTTIENWTPNVKPGTETKVIIPNAESTNFDPTLNEEETIGAIVIETGGIVNSTDTSLLFLTAGAGAWQNNGTFNPGTGTSKITFTSSDATISGTTNFNNLTIAPGAGLRALEGNYMSIAGTLTNNGIMYTTLIPNTIEFKGIDQVIPAPGGDAFGGYHHLKVSGAGATLASAITTLNIRGNLTLDQTVSFAGKTVNMAGTTHQIIGGNSPITFDNLTVNKESGLVVLNHHVRINGTLTLTAGSIKIGDKNLTLGNSAVAGVFGVNNMIIADGDGFVRRPYAGAGTYKFPIGETFGALNYCPIEVDIISGSFSDAFVEVNSRDEKHPDNHSSQNYLTKYWNVRQTGITGALATITGTYDPLDVYGAESQIAAAQLNGVFNQSTNPWIKFTPLSPNTLKAEGAILTPGQTSVFTGLQAGDFSVEVYGYGEFCQDTEAVLTAETVGGDAPFTYTWSNGLPNAQIVTVPTATVGEITYTLTVRDANGFVAADNNSPVKILPPSVGGTVLNASPEICAGSAPLDLQLQESSGNILYWQRSADPGFADAVHISNFTHTLSSAEIGPLNETTYFRAVVQNGTCPEQYSAAATVRITSTIWNGSEWADGVVPSSTKSVIFAGDYSTSAGDIVACSCQVNNGAVLTVSGGTSLTVQDAIVSNGKIVVESDANVVQVNDEALNMGSALVKRNLSFRSAERKEYNYLISPVEGVNLKTGIYRKADNTAVTAPFVLYHNETNNKFGTSTGAYIAGRSLAVKEPAFTSGAMPTAFFEGKLFNGRIAYNLAYSGAEFGYNLVGNPYPSNLDLNTFYEDNELAIEPTIRFWDNTVNDTYQQQGSGYSGNAYAIFNVLAGNRGTGISAPGSAQGASAAPRQPNHIVKVGQGFMVRATGSNKILNYSNQTRTADNTGSVFYGKGRATDDRYWLQLTAPSGITANTAVVYFERGNNMFGPEDSRSLGGSDEIYSIVQTEKTAINGRSNFVNSDVIPLGTRHFVAGTYTIALGGKEGAFANGQNIYLKDKQAHIITRLNEAAYTFESAAGETTGRFEIIYKPETVLAADAVSKEDLLVYRNGGDFVVQAKNNKITAIEVFDASGRLVYSVQPNSFIVLIEAAMLSNGTYILRIGQNGEFTARKIIK